MAAVLQPGQKRVTFLEKATEMLEIRSREHGGEILFL